MVKAQIIGGDFSKIIARQKSSENLEIGELLISEIENEKIIFQVIDLGFSSQISKQNLELISGLDLEENTDLEFFDENVRNYKLAVLKSILRIKKDDAINSKILPNFFSKLRSVTKEDLLFLTKPENSINFGNLRSGSNKINFDVFLDGSKIFSEHILVAATTGRGKSNLTKCVLFDIIDKDYCGVLILDPHDEYYGRNSKGFKDHPLAEEKIIYYTIKNPPKNARTLKINLSFIKPNHFDGVVYFSDAQKDALYGYYKKYKTKWIEAIILEKPLDHKFFEATISVVRRKIMNLLDLDYSNNYLSCNGIFDLQAGNTTITDIVNELDNSKKVIIDTSGFSGAIEILIGSIITTEILNKHKYYKRKGELNEKPIISIVLEEAPRVLGKEILEQGPNIFSTIAREGRKFKVGLYAITQLPSLIPRQILANINTKIILGIEMNPERQAIIESASQDLTEDSKMIASLDKGEAIISSNFTKFAMPIKIPLFNDVLIKYQNEFNKNKYLKTNSNDSTISDNINKQNNIRKDYSGFNITN
ncbi:MAG: ATP-binding protein [Nanoarchaeota archaeon]